MKPSIPISKEIEQQNGLAVLVATMQTQRSKVILTAGSP